MTITTERDLIGWGVALAGILASFAGGCLKIGFAEALMAAGPALTALAAAWGYTATAKPKG